MGGAEAARQAFYFGPYVKTKGSAWHPAADWISDDLIKAARAGGGIIADSTLEDEYQETFDKAAAMLKAVAIADEYKI